MKLLKELFLLPDGEDFILYAPLINTILKINNKLAELLIKIIHGDNIPDDESTLTVVHSLIELGIINNCDNYPNDPIINDVYMPTSVTFLPTSNCNLRCIYCYADSGATKKYLTVDAGKSAIDFICKNATNKGVKNIQVGFLGGGEPFLAWDFVTEIYEYAENRARQNGLTTFLPV